MIKIFYNINEVNHKNILIVNNHEQIYFNNLIYVKVKYNEGELFLQKDFLNYYTGYLKSNKPYYEFIKMLKEIEKRLNN